MTGTAQGGGASSVRVPPGEDPEQEGQWLLGRLAPSPMAM